MSDQATRSNVSAVDRAVVRSTEDSGFGVTEAGYVPKPFARILAEKLATARELFGDDLDLTSGSAFRKLLELTALEDARMWVDLGEKYDNSFVVSAAGEALTALGRELGHGRPFELATGVVTVQLDGTIPAGHSPLVLPRGSRLSTPGGHHVSLLEGATLSQETPKQDVPVQAFYPGPSHNLDPTETDTEGGHPQQIDRFYLEQDNLNRLRAAMEAAADAGESFGVAITHTEPLSGGEKRWPDSRYRDLLLRVPRSIWTVEAIELAVSLVPGVRQVQVRDGWGGLDIRQSIFGNFNFIERVFASERDLGSPYYFTVLVAPTPAAVWGGPNGLRARVESAIEDLRPISIFPDVEEAAQVAVGIACDLVVEGLPLPGGSRATVNASAAATALKARLLERARRYVASRRFGEPVRSAEMIWALLNEPGVSDVRNLTLLRYPPRLEVVDFATPVPAGEVQEYDCGENIDMQVNEVPVLIDDASRITIV